MRAAIETATGRLVELSSDSTVETLLANALAAGFPAGTVTVRTVTQSEATALLAAANSSVPAIKTQAERLVDALQAEGIITAAKATALLNRISTASSTVSGGGMGG
jgi:hypothetical protein